jgi:hypothetical protein
VAGEPYDPDEVQMDNVLDALRHFEGANAAREARIRARR